MSSIQFTPQPSSESNDTDRSRRMLGSCAGATLIELGIAVAGAQASSAVPGLCPRCKSGRYAETSTARYWNIFCSKQCEQEFISAALPRSRWKTAFAYTKGWKACSNSAKNIAFELTEEIRRG